ncbi:MAG: sigma 54-interacting transcriptional regulator [Mucilaginibacter sp.]|jgi:DNA-binding NtrC family response regulator|uniref:sigma 54-interacting transcriptional regulator n=1 Tax=Mucilaginibacter sp. TaxID=1882438 RepID=UPI0035631ACE
MKSKILIVEDEFIVANDLAMILENAGYQVCETADSVEEARMIVAKEKPNMVLLDIHLKGKLTGIDLAAELSAEDIPFVYLSANSNQNILEAAKATHPYGFMVKPFRLKDVLVTLDVAQYSHDQNTLARKMAENNLQTTLADILTNSGEWRSKFLKIAKTIQPHIPFDYLIVTNSRFEDVISYLRTGFNEYQMMGNAELLNVSNLRKGDLLRLLTPETYEGISSVYDGQDFDELCKNNAATRFIAKTFQMVTNLNMQINISGQAGFTFSFYSRKPGIYSRKHLNLIKKLEGTLSSTLKELSDSPALISRNEDSKVSELSKAAKPHSKNFEEIIGNSHLLLTALDHLSIVAPMDTTVLILGESGTGKERFAKSIHGLSKRNHKPLVVVNCAALPTHLIESELFGHEKGAFTGATDRRIGKFEQAAGGTLFLDEIGELPLESQAKLLRALQEKEIERLGGRETIKVDVRVIAATNCNLEKEVAAGKFRLDLYYRLNIFPITLPSLRERSDDIPQLATFFVDQFGSRAGKAGMTLSAQAIKDLLNYTWPGNVRELEHLMERTVLLNRGLVIDQVPLPAPKEEQESDQPFKIRTMDENERDYIIKILKKCNGRISGRGGAAEMLGLPATTLNSKMKRLGITR